jgi:ethanolamine ammonia-lyase small subunit
LLKLFDAQNTRLDAQDAVFEVFEQHTIKLDSALEVHVAVLDAKSMLLL